MPPSYSGRPIALQIDWLGPSLFTEMQEECVDCLACGRLLPDGARFCEYCGASTGEDPVLPSVQTQRVTEYWVCGTCSVENELGGAYCGSCGAPAPGVPTSPRASGLPQTPRRVGGTAPSRFKTPPPPAETPRSPGDTSRRWLWIVAAAVVAAAVVLAAALVLRDGASDAGDGQTAQSTQATGAQPTLTAQATVTTMASPATSSTAPADSTPRTWPGISSRPDTPFWGAFYCATSNKKKAIQAAQVGDEAGWHTLVLWTGDYGGIGRSGSDLWLICAGPFGSRSAARNAVDGMDAEARRLHAIRPDLDIHFGEAYVTLVE